MVSLNRDFINEEFAAVVHIIEKLIHDDSALPSETLEQLIQRGIQAAALRDDGPEPRIILRQYGGGVMGSIWQLSECTPPEKQSKLVELFVLLEKTEIQDVENGGVLEDESGDKYWSGLPNFVVFVDVKYGWWVERDSRTAEEDERHENFAAFLAQLSERNFRGDWFNSLSWNGNDLTAILKEQNRGEKALVRVVCMWLICAPNKVYSDATTSREEEYFRFKPKNWAEWKQILHDSEGVFDEDTEKLVKKALETMENTKA